MDTRTALKAGSVLAFSGSESGLFRCSIERELARGAMSIVYDASYLNNAGVRKAIRLKECYPFRLQIMRMDDGTLVADDKEQEDFQACQRRFRAAFDLGNALFDTSGLTNCTTNMLDIYAANQTLYVVSAYQEGMTLESLEPLTLKECLTLVRSTAEVIRRIHDHDWLYLDIKPENIFVLEGTHEIVQLFDFDSLVPMDIASRSGAEEDYRISHTRGFSAVEQQAATSAGLAGTAMSMASALCCFICCLAARQARWTACRMRSMTLSAPVLAPGLIRTGCSF
ncbi:MAG: hypothetical protein V8T10_08640 [Merdibacter sp.]